ncbi:UbiH/UbiF/VisC/COQ6 family ubiquinone biosynthesis hydroxylase [Falsirhodobacter deserti]|uniref:UbiH/UbiF/VisC/COQ6 family ubiquinone biosynthesis hydroxylase n=1 Tax=Falsirhodobacter deserti TaxID=1365611 RepID=UPI000FE39897|nr:UbiH/UbiF/VisC/COQ6 family ubiquinone biosynthesis hydroxylase [Falsirhodobacter deserti]
MSGKSDILIIGGGLNGLPLALALAQGGLDVTVVDARPAPARGEAGFDGRAYSLAAASCRLLRAVGVWDAVADQVQPILRIRTAGGRPDLGASPFVLTFDGAEIEDGPMGTMLEDRFLYAALLKAISAQPRIRLLSGEQVVDQGEGWALTASGLRLEARLVVGCDGRGSSTAQRAGIGRIGWDYGQTALVTAVEHEKPHGGTAHQLFLPTGPLAILPLPDNRSSIVWSERRSIAEAVRALPAEEYLAALRPRFGDFLGSLKLAGARFSYPLSLSLARSFVAPRLALVGDAAHGVHPLAGQGLNLGLRDVAALAEVVIRAARRGEDIGAPDVLARYQDWRGPETRTMALGMDAMNRLFSNENPILRLGRDLGLGAVNALPGLRRGFIRQAAGLSGHLPALLRGERP